MTVDVDNLDKKSVVEDEGVRISCGVCTSPGTSEVYLFILTLSYSCHYIIWLEAKYPDWNENAFDVLCFFLHQKYSSPHAIFC